MMTLHCPRCSSEDLDDVDLDVRCRTCGHVFDEEHTIVRRDRHSVAEMVDHRPLSDIFTPMPDDIRATLRDL